MHFKYKTTSNSKRQTEKKGKERFFFKWENYLKTNELELSYIFNSRVCVCIGQARLSLWPTLVIYINISHPFLLFSFSLLLCFTVSCFLSFLLVSTTTATFSPILLLLLLLFLLLVVVDGCEGEGRSTAASVKQMVYKKVFERRKERRMILCVKRPASSGHTSSVLLPLV